MPLTRTFIMVVIAAGVLEASPAVAFCSKPIEPHCMADGSLTDSFVRESRCRRAVEDHLEDLGRYRNCLTAEIEEVDKAAERIRNLLSEGGEKSRIPPASPEAPDTQTTAEAAN